MDEDKRHSKKNRPVIDSSDYAVFTLSSALYILNVISNCYVSYCMYKEGQIQWFATSLSLLLFFSLFTQVFSHIFFSYNNIADKACSPYLQHINAKSEGERTEGVARREFLEIHHQAMCPHSVYQDRLWTNKTLVDLENSKVNACQRICSQGVSVVLHLLHIGPVIRYIKLLKFRSSEMKKKQDDEEIEEKKIKEIERYFCKLCLLERAADYSLRDITLLRLFEALEAAPQVLLQLYLVFYSHVFSPRLLAPALLGTLQLSYCLALSVKYQRMPRRGSSNQTLCGLCCVVLYKLFLVSYRMLCLAVFAALYRGYLILLLFTHSLIMLLWILYLDSSFSSSNHEEIAFSFTVAMLKSFTFVNVGVGRSRNRVVLYHVIINVENVVIAAVWYYKTVNEVDFGLIVVASMGALYLVGLLIKTIYYTCCHPTKLIQPQPGAAKEVSVMYKNKGGPVTGLTKDNASLLKHDENADVIHFPSSNPGSTWLLGFIEHAPDEGSRGRMMTPLSYKQRYEYATYHSVPPSAIDSCSGYDSEVASIMSSKTPIYENLVRPNSRLKHPLQQPVSSLHHPVSSFHHPISSLHHPVSSLHHPVSSLHHPVSSLHHPVSSLHHPLIHHPISNVQHPVLSSLQHPFAASLGVSTAPAHQDTISGQTPLNRNNSILANPMVWQPQQLGPPSGRNSADRLQNNTDSLSSSGVYSEEERKLNLKARLESEYDSIEDKAVPTTSPDSDSGDHYENLPTVIKQASQVHSDGLTLQSINIQGPTARFDGSFETQNNWHMLQGSLDFAYGPQQCGEESSDYTSLKEIVTEEVPLCEQSSSDNNRFQTDV